MALCPLSKSLFIDAFPVDSKGFLIPVAGRCSVKRDWQEVLDEIVKLCVPIFEKDKVSVYVRGSVAAGTAMPNLSDVDVMLVVPNTSVRQLAKIDKIAKDLEVQFLIASGVDLEVMTEAEITKDKSLQLRISTEALHLKGPHHWAEKMRFRVSSEIVRHLPSFSMTYLKVPVDLRNTNKLIDLQKKILRAAKQLIRLGMELVIDRSQAYSRDLSTCIDIFSYYHPFKVKSMHLAHSYVQISNELEFENREGFIDLWNKLGGWLCHQKRGDIFPFKVAKREA